MNTASRPRRSRWGQDPFGQPITGVVIKWLDRHEAQDTADRADDRWSTGNLKAVRAALMAGLTGPDAVQHKPHPAAAPVTAVDREVARKHFATKKAITGASIKSRNAMFGTNLELARERGLVEEHIDDSGRHLIWLAVEAPRPQSVSGDGAGED